MRILVWFRADLRLDDNPALHHACAAARRGVIAVFAVCPAQWHDHDWAPVKVEFLLRNVACLKEQLKHVNIPLLILRNPTFDEIPDALLKLARRRLCDALYFNREYEVNERRRDEAVTRAFEHASLAVHAFHDQVTVPPGELRTGSGSFYTVFTPFRRAWTAYVREHTLDAPLPQPRPQPDLPCPPDAVPEKLTGFDLDQGQPERWPAGEGHALRQLTRFIDRQIADYRKRRDIPAADGTSRLSPYLALGVISPRRCLAEAREANRGRLDGGRAGPDTWISELVWREFYRHVLVGFPRVSMNRAFKLETERLRWRDDPPSFNTWCAGRTGFPIVDAGMRELAATGWMHNRVRMITAMFLTKDLLIDWRRGERHFMRHLVDGDLASNNGGWQWSASTGTDAAPYFRIFNPLSQGQRYDPSGDYIRAWVPELRSLPAAALHDLSRLDERARARLDYPPPVCDHQVARQQAIELFRRLGKRGR